MLLAISIFSFRFVEIVGSTYASGQEVFALMLVMLGVITTSASWAFGFVIGLFVAKSAKPRLRYRQLKDDI